MNSQITDGIAQFDALFADKRAWLVGLCARLSGDRDAAEDLAQETLIVAWKRRDRLYDEQRLIPWLAGHKREKRRIFEAFVSLFARLAHDAPLLITLEDFHWADVRASN